MRHVYSELVARSLQREGEYFPLDLDTPLPGLAGSPTLSETLYAFIHNWWWSEGESRRATGDDLAAAILAQRRPMHRLYLPAVRR